MNTDNVYLFTDGAADPNPGKGGYGVIISSHGNYCEFSRGFKKTTNNRMELMGVIFGLNRIPSKSKVEVFSDSRYVVDGISKGWAEKWKGNNWYRKRNKKAQNHDLWNDLLDVISKHKSVEFHWIKGHNNHPENDRCDQLAAEALKSNDLVEDSGYLSTQIPQQNMLRLLSAVNMQ